MTFSLASLVTTVNSKWIELNSQISQVAHEDSRQTSRYRASCFEGRRIVLQVPLLRALGVLVASDRRVTSASSDGSNKN